jgi:mono/diheme cytochrome c family protein
MGIQPGIQRTAAFLLFAFALVACAPTLPDNAPIREARWLEQNWGDEERFWFHHATQGTSTIPVPYDWFVALEQPRIWVSGPPPMMKNPEYLRRFGFIPSPSSPSKEYGYRGESGYGANSYGEKTSGRIYGTEAPYDPSAFLGNPDALPVGFARTQGYPDPVTGDDLPDQLGFSCAACHTGHFEYNGFSVRIDGGPAVTELGKFREALGMALAYTRYVPYRFSRFADRVLPPDHTGADRDALYQELERLLERGKGLQETLGPIEAQSIEEGFARLDALNRIGNQVFFSDLEALDTGEFDPLENLEPHTAPVNFPHTWTTAWLNWVQYDGSIMQPMVRNAGEALGVSARINLTNTDRPLYASSVEVAEIFSMEQMLAGDNPFSGDPQPRFKGLWAPKWPEDILGSIDPAKRDQGRALYQELCAGCHRPAVDDPSGEFWNAKYWTAPNAAGERYLRVVEIPVDVIGTDPAQATVLATRTVKVPAHLEIDPGTLPKVTKNGCEESTGGTGVVTETPFAFALGIVVEKTVNHWYDENGIPAAQREIMNGNRPNCLKAEMKYKARPLNGIWATAPFLHNGSVPNLYALLSPAPERPRTFCLGRREFDPINVGYQTDCPIGTFELDTTIPGNFNSGHEFAEGAKGNGVIGRALSEDERWALIEYMKSL